MTVVELIDILCHYPQDMRVVCHDGEHEDFFDIKGVYPKDANHVTDPHPHEKVLKLSPFEDGSSWDGA